MNFACAHAAAPRISKVRGALHRCRAAGDAVLQKLFREIFNALYNISCYEIFSEPSPLVVGY
jgi:hypothetical protein